MKSFAVIEADNDPAAVKEKLTAHGELLKELQAKVSMQFHMMEMMNGSAMMGGTEGAAPTK